MRFFSKRIQTVFTALIVMEFFVTSAVPVAAIKIPSPSKVASELERRYNLDLGAIQNQSQFFNVADNKKPAPEVSLFFSPSDPKEGEKISAKAFPIYFSNPEEALYYTWFLKRKECGSSNCDYDNNNKYDEEDWKIEAAKIMAQNGYEGQASDAPLDDDGYRARYGGDNKTNTPNHCYINDANSGRNYELVGGEAGDVTFGCPADTDPVCMENEEEVTSGTEGDSGPLFNVTTSSTSCSVSGTPTCSSAGTPSCAVGSPRCVSNLRTATACSDFQAFSTNTCTATTLTGAGPSCNHLFPNANGRTSGDGSFNESEEAFWGTDPRDPDTADNGNKDEANIVGLGQSNFTWNYIAGDKVGVVVEGTSMIATKHDDASYMIMWAFSKKDCPVENTGAYAKTIKGYGVSIPTARMDLNDCIEKNLIDPTQGGQATNLEVAVSATPDNPINDASGDKGGDIVTVQATVSNAKRNVTDMLFDWKVEISESALFTDVEDITSQLRSAGLLGNIRGNALDSIRVKLDMPPGITSGHISGEMGYLRFRANVTENFSSGIMRKGRSDVIVKFTSTSTKINAYKAGTQLDSSGGESKMKASLGTRQICNNDARERALCPVVRNEIIGLDMRGQTGLTDFYWTVNGSPLVCSDAVSNDCGDSGQQGNKNFFPVTGNVGDMYTVVATANNVSTGKTLTLSRKFFIVEPSVLIDTTNASNAWHKLLGNYKGLDGNNTPNYSQTMFEALAGGQLGFTAVFVPSFIASDSIKEWSLDGETRGDDETLTFSADKPIGGIYTLRLAAQFVQSPETRRALFDIWNISPFDSPEVNFRATSQVKLQNPDIAQGPFQGERKYLAALISYIPASVLFTFRMLLSAVLILFTARFLYALLRERRPKALADLS